MIPLVQCGGRLPLRAFALALGTWVFSSSSAMADDGGFAGMCQGQKDNQGHGAPGLHPGFYGFGLGYRLGSGYGGSALGVGADGGYPFYGGPGYPHGEPPLRRLGGISPFPYDGGAGFPSPGHPNYFGGIGQLVASQQVVTIGSDLGSATDYGPFTGVLPYPDTLFAPFTAPASGSSRGVSSSSPSTTPTNTARALGPIPDLAVAGRVLGIEAAPGVNAGGVRGLKISKVSAGTVAEKAGLHAGDVIDSINGYRTQQPGNLAWIIAHAAPDNILMMNVRTANDGKEHTIRARLP
jgi:hypothetical protein